MKIELTKEQYQDLIKANAIGNAVLGILGDSFPDEYKQQSNTIDSLQEYLLKYAGEFDSNDLIEDFEGKEVLSQEYYEEKIMPIVDTYDDVTVCDDLARALARRDFRRDFTQAEIRKMAKQNGGYLGVEMYDYEKKYWDEFDKHDYDRLEIVKKISKK